MLPSYLRSTGNIKAKVRSRSLLKSQIPRPESLCVKKEKSGQSKHRLTSALKIQGRFRGLRRSPASTSGSGRLSDSSRLSYLSQKMSQRAPNKVETSKSDPIVPLCQKIAIKHQGCSFLSQSDLPIPSNS